MNGYMTDKISCRAYASFVDGDHNKRIIVGGYTGAEFLNTIEMFTDEWVVDSLETKTTIYQHGASPGLTGFFFLAGGIRGSEYSVKVDTLPDLSDWLEEPDLNIARSRHSAGILQSPGGFAYVVAGGFNGEYLRTTEFLIDGAWQFGPDLPQALCCAGSYTNEDGFFVIGGHTPEGKFLDTIYHLKDVNSEWVQLEQKLAIARDYPTIFSVKDELVTCE